MHFENYLNIINENTPGIAESIRPSITSFVENYISEFDCMTRRTGLLYGQVQSGKTSQMLGIIAASADIDFQLFILLTSDNTRLQSQTLQRGLETLDTFNICGENDDVRFRVGRLRRPTLVILKKNQSVLRRWHDIIASSGFCTENPLFVIDDEADNASLNTQINQNDQSTINQLLERILHLPHSSMYLQVTATPQSILLQRATSDWSPDFTHYFEPGEGYLSGNFFYSEDSICSRPTDENERNELLRADDFIPEGLRRAFWVFVVAGFHLIHNENKEVCNFLIHPGFRTHEHGTLERKINLLIGQARQDLQNNSNLVVHELRDAWEDLHSTKSDLIDFDFIREHLEESLSNISIVVINSLNDISGSYEDGMNVVIGGNSLGRGLTLPRLQTVYYCRTARTPQADTCWQHSRIFGYDRDSDLCRIFLPPVLLRLFRELNEANDALSGIIRQGNSLANYSILSPRGSRPTRPSVIERGGYDIWSGGVNYFPDLPLSVNLSDLDSLLGGSDTEREADLDLIRQVISQLQVEPEEPWKPDLVNTHISALQDSGYDLGCHLVIRVNRNVGKGTGTLLSPNDRALTQSAQYRDRLVLVMYRLNGTVDQEWEGEPLWVPNVKFPVGTNYYHNV